MDRYIIRKTWPSTYKWKALGSSSVGHTRAIQLNCREREREIWLCPRLICASSEEDFFTWCWFRFMGAMSMLFSFERSHSGRNFCQSRVAGTRLDPQDEWPTYTKQCETGLNDDCTCAPWLLKQLHEEGLDKLRVCSRRERVSPSI